MRRILPIVTALSLAAATPALSAEAAGMPGSWLLGGSVSWSSLGGDALEDRVQTLLVLPSAVAFVAPGLGVGAQTEIARVSQGDAVDVSHSYLGKVLYMAPIDGPVRPVVSVGGGFIRQSTNDPGEDQSVNGWAFRLAGGAFWFLNEHYAVVAELDYAYDKLLISEGNDPASDTIALAVGFAGFVF